MKQIVFTDSLPDNINPNQLAEEIKENVSPAIITTYIPSINWYTEGNLEDLPRESIVCDNVPDQISKASIKQIIDAHVPENNS